MIPKALKKGDRIAWISPSMRFNSTHKTVVARATSRLEAQGYRVVEIFHPDDPSSIQSSISNRLSEFRTAFSDPDIAAVFCTIGGPSFTELIPALAADTALHESIRRNPKIVVGFSDISGVHWLLHALTGLRTFYGPGASELGQPSSPESDKTDPVDFCMDNLLKVITSTEAIGDLPRSHNYIPGLPPLFLDPETADPGSQVTSPAWQWIRGGRGEGRLFGGCVTVIVRLGGVPALRPDWRDKIVFIESAGGDDEGGLPLGRWRAAVADLIAQGVFDEARGLVVGRPYGYASEDAQKEYVGVLRQLLCEGRLAETNRFPILFNVDIGHTVPLLTLPFDTVAVLDSEKGQFAIIEPAVL
jgi:muramoyltetrapeptide carboxypeptidase LdcA involved in peptidoglycan recycling